MNVIYMKGVRMNKYSVPFWEITELPTGHFIAEATKGNKLCYPERRVYFSRHSLEQDFGQREWKAAWLKKAAKALKEASHE